MLRKATIYLIFASMVVHCACRIGFVSYLYQQRYVIAFNLGLVDEIPIAICAASYDGHHGLMVKVEDVGDKSLPAPYFQAREITLFMISDDKKENAAGIAPLLEVIGRKPYKDHTYPDPLLDIFQPPRV